MVELFRYPTVAALAGRLAGGADRGAATARGRESARRRRAAAGSRDVAVVGYAVPLPRRLQPGRAVAAAGRRRGVHHHLRRRRAAPRRRRRGAARRPGLRARRRRPRAPGALRRRLLRLHAARGGADGPAAPGVPRVRLAGAGGRRLRPAAHRRPGRGVRRRRPQHLPAPRRPGAGLVDGRRLPGLRRQRQGLRAHPRLLPARPRGPQRHRADRLLQLAGGGPPGVPEPARRRVRRGAGRRRHPARAVRPGLPLRGGRHPVAGRPLPRLRRPRRRHRAAAAAPASWCSSRWPRRSPTATRSTR